MPRCEAILETTNDVCNSNLKLNKVLIVDPNGKYSKTIYICQKCSDRIYGPMDALLQHWMNKRDVDWEIKKTEITNIRWRNCRHCNHKLECHCSDPVCSNMFNEIWHVIFFSYQGKLRQDFQLHRKCAFIVMKKLGMIKELKLLSDQVSMEKFLGIQLTEPPKVEVMQQQQKPISVPHKKHCQKCSIWLDDEQYKLHMEQHQRESSTDNILVKQFTGKPEKRVETHVCELHSRRAIFLPSGEWACPVFGCIEPIKLKMLSVQESEDYMICLFHQCKLTYDPNSGKMRCQNGSCENKQWIKRSYLLSMVREGYVQFNGQKVPIDIDSRTVVLDGYKIILKI